MTRTPGKKHAMRHPGHSTKYSARCTQHEFGTKRKKGEICLVPNLNIMTNTQNTTWNAATRLSAHFTLGEFIVSGTALKHHLDNTPKDPAVFLRLQRLVEEVLEPLRLRFGRIRISSGYRSKEVNSLVGGSPRSQHMQGYAADLHIGSREEGMKYFEYIRRNLPFDQLLFEHKQSNGCRWLHVSFVSREANRQHAVANYKV